MNIKSICLGPLCVILLVGCGSAPAAPPAAAPTPVVASAQLQPAATSASTAQPQPSSSPTPLPPTIEPSPSATRLLTPLPGSEPLLLYQTDRGLRAAREDGSFTESLHTTLTPTVGRNLNAGIAPHEMSAALYVGDNPMTPDREGDGPLTLNLLHVPTGNSKQLTPLFSPEMVQAIEAAVTTFDRTAAIEAGIAVIENDHTLAWSPDGRYLAFIAASDGPSSDVYSYDRESATINRLTDGPNQAARLFWSPDSQWVIHEEVESFGTGAGWNVQTVWAAAPDGSGNRKLYDAIYSGDEVFVDWVSADTFLVYSWTAVGLQNIRLVNLDSGEAQRIGPEFPVQALAFDPEAQAQLTVIDDYTAQQNNLQGGLYLASPAADQLRLIAPGSWYDVRWLPQAQLFFAKGEEGVISVALDGATTEYFGEDALPIDSPDGAWLLAWGNGNFTGPIGLRLYTPDGELARAITTDAVTFATWSPDANGVFYVSDGALYYAAIPNGESRLIEESVTVTEPGSLGWVLP
jgi:hypothetical protein